MYTLTSMTSGSQADISEAEFDKRVSAIAARFRTSNEADLEIRHETGDLLNLFLGGPNKRNQRGSGITKNVAAHLQFPVSEISRMRRFADYFKSPADLKQSHPTVTTWTAVKALLPTLNPKAKKQSTNGTATSSQPQSGKPQKKLSKIARTFKDLPKLFSEVVPDLLDGEKKGLVTKFQAMAQAIGASLKVSVSVSNLPMEETPSASPVEVSNDVPAENPGC
jgi:hypothetical protein